MASSSPGDSGDPFPSSSSLFEGMVLFAPSDLSPLPQNQQPSPPTRPQQPLDEDLFSDLTLLDPPPPPHEPPHEPSPDVRNHGLLPRQISRKKKRGGVRIGYAREAPVPPVPVVRDAGGFLPRGIVVPPPDDDASSCSSSVSAASSSILSNPVSLSIEEPSPPGRFAKDESSVHEVLACEEEIVLPSVAEVEVETAEEVGGGQRPERPEGSRHSQEQEVSPGDDDSPTAAAAADDTASASASCEENAGIALEGEVVGDEVMMATFKESSFEKDDAFVLTEGNLELIRNQIAQRLDEIREMAESVCAKRKVLARKRREVAESVASAGKRYKDLEKELEEACEAEDFEKAERVSEDLAAAEKEREKLVCLLREAEVECDSIESKMQVILQMQITAEEEGTRLLEQFAKDAAEDADLILKNVEEFCSREREDWQRSSEELELKRLEIDVEMRLIDEARSGIETSIEHSIQDDEREKDTLCKKQDALVKELEELLELVRFKEAEITENKFKILEVEKRISNVVNQFDEAKSNVNVKYGILQSALSNVDAEIEVLSARKKDIDENQKAAEHKRAKLLELANTSSDEAKKCHDLVALRRSLALPILKSQEDKVKLATIEKQISDNIQILQEQISAARTSLQELSLNRSSAQEEIASLRQRVAFIEKKIPDLEAEKKVAAAARNFKEAGRVAAEAKALSLERDSIQLKMEEGVSKLNKLEEDVQRMTDNIHESERLIESKEKEAARARYQRLCLVAAAARAERFTSLTLGDLEEGDVSLEEAEAMEANARELLELYGLDAREMEGQTEEQFSLSLLINLSGKRLALMASSLGLAEVD